MTNGSFSASNCQNLDGDYDPNRAVPPGQLNKQFDTILEWYNNLDARVKNVDRKFNQMTTNDPAHDARRLGAMRLINNLKAELYNKNFYLSQQGVLPYGHVKRMETQFNAIGLGYLNGFWKITRCGQGMYWHMCGDLIDLGGR